MENIPSFQGVREQKELTEEQETYVDQFIQECIAVGLSMTDLAATEAEEHLRLVYQIVGLEPPQIRWFDSPLVFALAPESAPQSIETLLRTSVEAKVATTITERISEPVWDGLFTMIDVIGDGVWYNVGRLIQDAVLESVGRDIPTNSSTPNVLTKRDLESSLWTTARASLWTNNSIKLSLRVEESVQAYSNAAFLAFSAFFARVFGPHDLVHLARFNELVSGYRLGRTEAWLVRKPTHVEHDEEGSLHSEYGMCLRYRDGWGFYAWHGSRVPEKLILHPEQVIPEDWLQQKNENVRRAIQEQIGHRRFSKMVGGFRMENGALIVDLGNGSEQTGYVVHMQNDVPRVCLLPRVFFERHCQQQCSRTRPCPLFSDLSI